MVPLFQKKSLVTGFLILLLCISGISNAVPTAKEGEINVNLSVNYGSAYKNKTWVPVDIYINNQGKDISGFLEVKTFSNDSPQSPKYKKSISSQKGSMKRYQIYCFLENTTKIEVNLYHKNRRVLEFSPWITVRSINEKDLLGLILDDEASDYGFLHNILKGEKSERRFHRENLKTEQIGFLADHPECYKSFDVIIMGNIDPEKISTRHRDLLIKYIRQGGTLIVSLGNNERWYKGTWVEELLGIKIGTSKPYNEVDLADLVFAKQFQGTLKDHRQGVLSELIPQSNKIKSIGATKKIVTIKKIGKGHVAAIAVDGASRIFQDSIGFLSLWHSLCTISKTVDKFNYKSVENQCLQSLPYLTGITLYSKASVILYLMLYLLFGVIANWLICNKYNKREFAWLFLIIFSLGFSLFAMVFGTSGRAKSSEMEQIEILHIPFGGNLASLDSIVGVMTARTTTCSVELKNEFSLAKDISGVGGNFYSGQVQPQGNSPRVKPIDLVFDKPISIKNIKIGASEMKLFRVESETNVSGGVEGNLILDYRGLSGKLSNKTGFDIQNPYLLLNGHLFSVQKDGEDWKIDIELAEINGKNGPSTKDDEFARNRYNSYYYYNNNDRSKQEFRNDFLFNLFTNNGFEQVGLNMNLGPYLCGWSKEKHLGSILPNEKIKENIKETLIVADIKIQNHLSDFLWKKLLVSVENSPNSTNSGNNRNMGYGMGYGGRNQGNKKNLVPFEELTTRFQWEAGSTPVIRNKNPQINIPISISDYERNGNYITLEVSWLEDGSVEYILEPLKESKGWQAKHKGKKKYKQLEDGTRLTKVDYKLMDWKSLYNQESKGVNLIGKDMGVQKDSSQIEIRITAKIHAALPTME